MTHETFASTSLEAMRLTRLAEAARSSLAEFWLSGTTRSNHLISTLALLGPAAIIVALLF